MTGRPPGTGRLPRLLVVTDRAQAAPRPLVEVVARSVAGGARAVLVREKDLPADERAELVAGIRPLVEVLLVASEAPTDADGVHLAAGQAWPGRRPGLVGRSCHDRRELARAAAEGCDYVTVSPVFASASKPGYGPALGLDGPAGLAGLARLGAPAGPRVYALGGVTPALAGPCLAAGAHGVAVMGAVMRAEDPTAVVAALVAEVERGARRAQGAPA